MGEVYAEVFRETGEGKGVVSAVELDDAHLHEVVADDAVDTELLGHIALFPTQGLEIAKCDCAYFEGVEDDEVGFDGSPVGVLGFLCLPGLQSYSLGEGIAHAARCARVDEEGAAMAVYFDLGDEFSLLIVVGDGGAEGLRCRCEEDEGQDGEER